MTNSVVPIANVLMARAINASGTARRDMSPIPARRSDQPGTMMKIPSAADPGDYSAAASNGDGPFENGVPMNWIALVVAGLFEIGWAVGLKYADGFTRFWPSVATIVAMALSVVAMGVGVFVGE